MSEELRPSSGENLQDLTIPQIGIWLAQKLLPGRPVWNLGEYLDIGGDLDPERFERALRQVVARADSLWIRVAEDENGPKQYLVPPSYDDLLQVIDLSDHEDPVADARRAMADDMKCFVDLEQDPVFRFILFKIASDRWFWFLRCHHFCADGITLNFIATWAAEAYSEPDREYPPTSVFDLLTQEQAYRASQDFAADADYWRAELEDPPDAVTISGKAPVKSGDFMRLSGTMSREDYKRFTSTYPDLKTSDLFMAATALYLCRLSGSSDLIIGMAFARRRGLEHYRVAGMSSGVVPLRLKLKEESTLREMFADVYRKLREASRRQRFHETEIRGELGLKPDATIYGTIVNTMPFNYDLSFGSCQVDLVENLNNWMIEDFSILAFDRSESKDLDIQTIAKPENYAPEEHALHHERLLEFLTRLTHTAPDTPVREIEVLGRRDHELLSNFRQGVVTRGDVGFEERFAAQVIEHREAPAVILGEEEVSYGELDRRSDAVASYLNRDGVAFGDLVGIAAERSIDLIVGLLGILKAGAAYVPIDPDLPQKRRDLLISEAGIRLLLATEKTESQFKNLAQGLSCRSLLIEEALRAEPETSTFRSSAARNRPQDSLAYVNFTSGSTGLPKGVLVTRAAVVRLVVSPNYVDLNPQTRTLQMAPIHFDAATFEIWGPLLNGGALVLMPPESPTLEQLERTLREQEVNTLWLTAGLFRRVVDEILPALQPLKFLLAGGDVLSVEHVKRVLKRHPGIRMINGYGPTESTTFSNCADLTLQEDYSLGAPIGPPINETYAYVLDHRLLPVPVGVTGDLYLSGTGLARGYLGRPGFTASKFIPNPSGRVAGDRLYVTGDRAAWREDGALLFFGRADRQIKLRGFRIEPGEIETLLSEYAGVEAALVFLDPADKSRLLAAVKSQEALKSEDLERFLGQRLPDYMTPKIWVVVDEFPVTVNGKIDRKTLAAQARAQSSSRSVSSLDEPGTPVERLLCDIFGELLGRDETAPLGIHENLFEAGCDSLVAMQAVYRARRAKISIDLEHVFRTPNIAGLARRHQAEHADPELLQSSQISEFQDGERPERIPLSFSQRRLWFVNRLTPNHAYNIPLGFHFRGELDVSALEQALRDLVRRHEIFRTVFYEWEGAPFQKVLGDFDFDLSFSDVSDLDDPMASIDREFERRARRTIDLETSPPWEASLFKAGDQDHVLLLIKHHIISDGWSLSPLFADLEEFYRTRLSGTEPETSPLPLPSLPLQYADYSVWDRGRIEDPALSRQLEWWKEQLLDAPEQLNLPRRSTLSESRSFRGMRLSFTLDEQVTSGLKNLGKECGSTLYMTLLAIYADFLARYADTQDLVVGTPVHGRSDSELKNLIGCFVNMLALRLDFRNRTRESVEERLAFVRERVVDAWSYQDFPLDVLVDELNPVRRTSRMPLFQAVFVLQPTDPELRLGDLKVRQFMPEIDSAKFDLTLDMKETDGTLEGVFEYSLDLFDPEIAADMLRHFSNLAAAYAEASAQERVSLPGEKMLDEAEVDRLLRGWNPGMYEFPEETCIHRIVAAHAERTPHAIALQWTDGEFTYEQLAHRIRVLAEEIKRLGVALEDRVATCLPRGPELIVSWLAVLEAGATYVQVDPKWPAKRRAWIAEDAEISLAIVESSSGDDETAGAPRLCFQDVDFDQPTPTSPTNPAADLRPACINYTSGSTGRPKGVLVTHRGIVRLVCNTNYVDLDQETAVLQVSNVSFDASTFEIWASLLNGGRCVLYPDEIPEPRLIGRMIAEKSVNTLLLPTALFNRVVSEDPRVLRGVRQLLIGGEVMSPEHVAQAMKALPETRFINAYGPTENAVISSCFPLKKEPTAGESVPIGFPIAATQVYVLDRFGGLVPPGAVGELYVGGEGLARGYFKRPGLTGQAFVPDPFSAQAGARLYRTGDLVSYTPFGDAQGSLRFHGRIDHQVKIRGFRIELGEIENRLMTHESITEAVVLVHGEGAEKRLVGYVVAQGEAPTSADLSRFVNETLPDYMVPRLFQFLPSLPLTTTGKLNRKALPAPDEFDAAENYQEPRTPLEERLVEVWTEVLFKDEASRSQPIGVHDNFFELGGNSLSATQVISRLRDDLGLTVAVRELFEGPTVAELAQQSAGQAVDAEPEAPSPILVEERPEKIPLSSAQRRLWFMNRIGADQAYNMPLGFRLRGELDVAALERAFRLLVGRHEILRTRFYDADGTPYQEILAEYEFEFEVRDVASSEDPAEQVRREFDQRACRSFDFKEGPPWEISLYKTADTEHVLVLIQHHIISDGWSLKAMFTDLEHFYRSAVSGTAPAPTSDPAPLPLQYADYSVWEQRRLEEGVLEQDLSWWEERLRGAPEELDLPGRVARTESPESARLGCFTFTLDERTTSRLQLLGTQCGSTLYMTLLAIYSDLLSRYSGAQDIVIGTPVHGRSRPELEEMIGFFVNVLPLRFDFRQSAGRSVADHLATVRERVVEAWAHQDVPFEVLVGKLNPERRSSRTPLFEVLFVLQPEDSDLEMEGLAVDQTLTDLSFAKFNLMLEVKEKSGAVEGTFLYSVDRFDAALVEAMNRHLVRLIEAYADACEDAHLRLPQLKMLDDPEVDRLLHGWNPGSYELPEETCIHRIFAAQAERTPHAIALQWTDGELTYQQLLHRARVLAEEIRRLGVVAEDRVATCLPRGPELISSLLGILEAGAIYVPVDPKWPTKRRAWIAEDAEVSLVIVEAPVVQGGGGDEEFAAGVPRLRLSEADFERETPAAFASPADDLQAAYINYTSGSTGRPKGVLATHRAVVRLLFNTNYVSLDEASAILHMSNASFDAATFEIWAPLLNGGRCVLYPDEAPDPRLISRMIQEKGVDVLFITTALFHRIVSEDPLLFRGVKHLYTGGEALSSEHMAKAVSALPETRLSNIYGPTENTVFSSWFPLERAPAAEESVPIGFPVANTQAYVLNSSGDLLPPGAVGELCVGGEGLARGYFKRPGRTAQVFVPDPFSEEPGARLYRTGDRVAWREDGALLFFGRADRQVKMRGFRIELGEIETLLSSYAGIESALVFLDPEDKSRLMAAVKSPEALESEDLERFLGEQLPDYMVPRIWAIVEVFPLSVNGKIDRRALVKQARARSPKKAGSEAARLPAAGLERQIATLWSEALGLDEVGLDENFFHLGGHSLALIQVHGKLCSQLRIEPPIVKFFEYPTIATLADYLRRFNTPDSPTAEPETGEGVDRAAARRRARARKRSRR